MATPQPTDGDVDRSAPHGQEAGLIVRALASAPRPTNGLMVLQAARSKGRRRAMLGLDVDLHPLEPVEPTCSAKSRRAPDNGRSPFGTMSLAGRRLAP
jgi:hypothetical protein